MKKKKKGRWWGVGEGEGGTVSGPTAGELAQHLSQRGLAVQSETITKVDGSIGGAVLEFAETWNADLLIKGAFTHSRLRQLIFGGATRDFLSTFEPKSCEKCSPCLVRIPLI